MTRTIAIVALTILFAATAFAADGKLSYGVKLGLNMANQKIDPTPSGVTVKGRTGFGVGAIINYSMNEKMAIRTDILYLQKGSKMEATGYSGESNFTYLAIEPFWTYKFSEWSCKLNSKMASAFFQVGPEIGLCLSAKDKDDKDITGKKSTEIGLNVGVGINMPMGKGYLSPELRYNMGLTSAAENGGTKATNNGIGIMFGYMF
ncbi:MAG: PorT family protein [bacterium]|nr:PorT family protein [bacterium]